MEWIKPIIEKAEIKDNKINLEPVMEEIKKTMKDHVIGIEEYNNINTQLTQATKTIDDLKKSNKDNTDLQEVITKHETEVTTLKKEHKKELENIKKKNAINSLLMENKAKYPDLLRDKFDLDKILVNGEDVTGIKEQFDNLRTEYTEMFASVESKGDDSKGSDYTYIPGDSATNTDSKSSGGFVNIIKKNQSRK